MCRGKNVCTELGTDPAGWDIYCPLRKPEWMNTQILIFESAVNHFILGDRDACIDQLKEIDSESITQWYIEHGQMSGRHRKIILNIQPPALVPDALRDPVRSPQKIQKEVFKRDGYKCRYCGNRLIAQEFIKAFIKQLNSPLFQRGKTNLTTHGIIHISWPVADHVIPWNRGGKTDLNNLVSACAACNYGKDGNTIEQLGIQNPFERFPVIDGWNGLLDKIRALESLE